MKKIVVVILIIVAIAATLVPSMVVGAQDATETAQPTGWLSGYVNQGAPGVATPPPSATIVASSTQENGFDGNLPQDYDAQGKMFGVSVYGEEGKDGWSWSAWDWLVVKLNQAVSGVKVFIDNYGSTGTYAEINGNTGDEFAFKCEKTPCQIDFSWTPTPTPEPTEEVPPTVPPTTPPSGNKGQWLCVELCNEVPPNARECLIPIAASSIKWTDTELVFIPASPNSIIRVDGHVSVAHFVTANNEAITMVFTPNVCYGDCNAKVSWWANGCYIESSSWHPEGLASGPMTISGTDPTNAGPGCTYVWVWVPDVNTPTNENKKS